MAEVHFNKQADRHRQTQPRQEDITCAVCGADLTGHGQVEKYDKVYCAVPGCGYPLRDDVGVVGA
ncbi:MAG: hypothetical protein MUO26_03935 [Methanotrichaceae archaeon]|nr:hypothetical protein [Methanotrichaceae archaeon]